MLDIDHRLRLRGDALYFADGKVCGSDGYLARKNCSRVAVGSKETRHHILRIAMHELFELRVGLNQAAQHEVTVAVQGSNEAPVVG